MLQSSLFEGRMARLPYMLSVVGLWVIMLLVQPLILDLNSFTESGRILNLPWRGDYAGYGAALDDAIAQTANAGARYAAFAVVALGLFAGFLILSARRLRDIGRPGRYALMALIPFVGAQALFAVLILLPGDAGQNAYGPGRATRDAGRRAAATGPTSSGTSLTAP